MSFWCRAEAEGGASGLERQVLPVPSDGLDAGEGARLHAVDIDRPPQMIDFVLQDPREPAGRFDALRPRALGSGRGVGLPRRLATAIMFGLAIGAPLVVTLLPAMVLVMGRRWRLGRPMREEVSRA